MSDTDLEIRLADPDDPDTMAAVAAIYAPIVRDTSISFELDPPDASEFARRVRSTLPRYPWLVGRRGGVVCGYAYGGTFRGRAAYRWCVETSVYVADHDRGRGTGLALYHDLIERLRRQGFRMAYAGTTLPNDASMALHARAGFEPAGTFARAGQKAGAWHDVAWWQMDLAPHLGDAPPTGEPAPVTSDA